MKMFGKNLMYYWDMHSVTTFLKTDLVLTLLTQITALDEVVVIRSKLAHD